VTRGGGPSGTVYCDKMEGVGVSGGTAMRGYFWSKAGRERREGDFRKKIKRWREMGKKEKGCREEWLSVDRKENITFSP